MQATPSLFNSKNTAGLRNRLAKFKAPDVNVIHDSLRDNADEEDSEAMMQSFLSASSGLSSEDSDTKAKRAMVDSEDEDSRERDEPEQRGNSSTRNTSTFRRFSSQSNTSPRPPMRRSTRRSSGSIYVPREPKHSSSSWWGLDLSIIVALVSPLGNLLTGGDHIKNVLLLFLLVYYLHQLVEVPWSLYRMSLTDPSASDRLQNHASHAELRSLELLYLSLTVLSPFLGAMLLRLVATTITGDPETLSWFSTGLFVLATGLRPWTHLVQRLKDRSHALQELVAQHAAEEEEEAMEMEQNGEMNSPVMDEMRHEVDGAIERVGELNSRVTELSKKNHHEWTDLAEHVAEVVDSVEDALRRHRTAITRANQTNDARFAAFEARLEGIDAALDERKKGNGILTIKGQGQPPPYLRGEQLKSLVWETLALPWTVAALCWMYVCWALPHVGHGAPSLKSSGKRREIAAPDASSRRRSSLEPIPEEEDVTSVAIVEPDRTLVCESPEPEPDKLVVSVLKFLFSPLTFAGRIAFLALHFPQTMLRSVLG